RLWTEDDLALFFVFRSVGEFIERHPDFPSPLPLRIRGRRWRPCDVLTWANSLTPNPNHEGKRPAIPRSTFPLSPICLRRRNMRRTPNPNGNPVAVRKKGDIYKVRYYPRGCSPTPPTARNSQVSFAHRPHPKRRPLFSVSDSSST